MSVSNESLREQLKRYPWFHRIPISEGVSTEPDPAMDLQSHWDSITACLDQIDFKGKRVLDVGCRDGLFSLEAEKRGAAEVIGIDNDLSKGAVEFLLPHLKSKVRMVEMNLNDLTEKTFGPFDVILFFGVLYHLRYPIWSLRRLSECLPDGGLLAVESGMLIDKNLARTPLLYCPVAQSPYEPTSCSFFTEEGLRVTLETFDLRLLSAKLLSGPDKKPFLKTALKSLLCRLRNRPALDVGRAFFLFEKNLRFRRVSSTLGGLSLNQYWDSIHSGYSRTERR